jgi:hypothetical protein
VRASDRRQAAIDKIRAECEERWIYPLASDPDTGSVIMCEQCPCLVTPEKFEEAKRAVARLESEEPHARNYVYLVRWFDGVLDCQRTGRVH